MRILSAIDAMGELKMPKMPIHHNQLSVDAKSTFKKRAWFSLLIVAIVVPCAILGGWFYFGLVAFIVGFSTYEVAKAPSHKFSWLVWLITFICMYALVFWIMIKNNSDNWEYFDVNKSFLGFSISPIALAVMAGAYFLIVVIKDDFSVSDAFYLIAMSLLLSLGFQAILSLRYYAFHFFPARYLGFDINEPLFKYFQSTFLLFYLLIAIAFNDVGAYLIGLLFGKHKLNPRISPKKTWEGFVGGIIFSTLMSMMFALIVAHFNFPMLPVFTIDKWYWVLLCSVILPFVGNLGDFTFSAIKRHFGIKDYSKLLGPHGGILDRVDSLIFGSMALSILVIFITNGWNFFA